MARILLVDDDLELSNTLAGWLTHEQHAVDLVHTGVEGWERASKDQYDLLILDWDLPDVNGIDVLKRLRASGRTTGVLMLTGHASVVDRAQGLDAGADDYLTKPFHVTELSARVRALLRRQEIQKPFHQPLGSGNEEVLSKAYLAGSLLASRYEILEVAGQGGLGIVFKARQPMLEKLVAIKMLRPDQINPEGVERFKIEAKAASALDHPNIVNILDFGVTELNQPYMVMEYIQGRSLEEMVEKLGPPPLPTGLDICIQVSDGLAHAHEMGILHRDIKSSNIMLKKVAGRPPLAKILDFGLAKLQKQDQTNIKLTQKGQLLGSPPYMSPEQVRGKTADERSDIYSLGCVLYEVVTGFLPYMGTNSQQVMTAHLEEDLTPARQIRPDLAIPDSVELVISKALAKSPSDRFQTMSAFNCELKRICMAMSK